MGGRAQRILVFLALCGLCLIAAAPLFTITSWFHAHDSRNDFYLLQEFRRVFDSGTLYPRWLPDLVGGYGYPNFLYYPPGTFLYLMPFLHLPLAWIWQIRLGLFGLFLIAAAGSYRLARDFGLDRLASVCMASFYVFQPYAYANIYIRGDFAEFASMMPCPWIMVGLFRIRNDTAAGAARWSSFAIYVLALTSVYLAHPYVALFMTLIIAWFVLIDCMAGGIRSRAVQLMVLGGMMAATLAAPYWFTAMQMASYVTLGHAAFPIHQTMPFIDLFYRTNPQYYPWWLASFGIISPVVFGLALLASAGMLRTRLFWQVIPPLLLVVFLNTDQSLPLWHAFPRTAFLQFAWRVTAVVGILEYIAVLQLGRLQGRLRKSDYHLLMVALAVFAFVFQPGVRKDGEGHFIAFDAAGHNRYLQPLYPITVDEDFVTIPDNLTDTNEYDPLWMDKKKLADDINPEDRILPRGKNIHVEVDPAGLPAHVRGTVDIGKEAFAGPDKPSITIGQIDFPGRVTLVDGKESDEQFAVMRDDAGRVKIMFAKPGHYSFDSYYEGPPHWLLRNSIVIVVLAALVWLVQRLGLVMPLRFRNNRSTPGPEALH